MKKGERWEGRKMRRGVRPAFGGRQVHSQVWTEGQGTRGGGEAPPSRGWSSTVAGVRAGSLVAGAVPAVRQSALSTPVAFTACFYLSR